MVYDFWDTMKKYLKGGLTAGTGSNAMTVKPTMNPVEAASNIHKVYALKNQSKLQQASGVKQNTAGTKQAAQLNTNTNAGGYAALQNPVFKSISDMVFNKSKQNTGNTLNQQNGQENTITKIDPVSKNTQDMVLNSGKQKTSNLNKQIKTGAEVLQNINNPIKQNEKLQLINNTMENGLNDHFFSNGENGEAHIKSNDPMDVKYELLNSKLKIPMMVDGGSSLINYVKEKNREDAIQKVQELNGFSNSEFEPILNEIKNAKTVNFEYGQKNITVDDKRNEAIENNTIKRNVKSLIALCNIVGFGKDIVSSLINRSFNLGKFISDEFISNGSNDLIDSILDKTATKYTGCDKQGDEINQITRQSMNIEFSKEGTFGQSYIGKSKIDYEYHIVDNARRILSISVNGNQVYNNYQNQ